MSIKQREHISPFPVPNFVDQYDLYKKMYVDLFSRGSLGYGEEALQSLPGKVGQQVVNTG